MARVAFGQSFKLSFSTLTPIAALVSLLPRLLTLRASLAVVAEAVASRSVAGRGNTLMRGVPEREAYQGDRDLREG